jgi:hypothetical protein
LISSQCSVDALHHHAIKPKKGHSMTKRENVQAKLEGNPLCEENYARHLFSMWITGCYGQELFSRQQEIVKRDFHNERAMRRFVINEFCDMLASECDCSAGYAQSIIAATYDKPTLTKLTAQLIAEVRDYHKDLAE